MTNWVQRQCKTCGATFTIAANNRRLYCCSSCRDKGKRERTAKTKLNLEETLHKVCPICNEEFRAASYRAVYCSKACSDEANRRRARNRYEHRAERCIICGQILTGNQSKFCSEECEQKLIANLQRRKTPYTNAAEGHYLDVTAGADETANSYRCECKLKKLCKYSRSLGGSTANVHGYMYCAYMEITGEMRGGYPDECTHFKRRGKK